MDAVPNSASLEWGQGDHEAHKGPALRPTWLSRFACCGSRCGGGEYLKSMVYGGLDGIITTFAAITAVAGADLSLQVVMITTLASLIADALSMGVGDYVSEMSERSFAKAEREREEWETENYLDGEKGEMIELYRNRGLTEEEAIEVVDIMSRNEKVFVDIMMVQELGILPPDDSNPWLLGVTTFFSFIIFGSVPLAAYGVTIAIYGISGDVGVNLTLGISAGMAAITMFILGAIASRWSTSSFWKMGLLVMLNGSFAAGAAFGVAYLLQMWLGVDTSLG